MTSRADPEDVRRGLDLGAGAYITKQKFDQRELRQRSGSRYERDAAAAVRVMVVEDLVVRQLLVHIIARDLRLVVQRRSGRPKRRCARSAACSPT